jgi:hypothetical protein
MKTFKEKIIVSIGTFFIPMAALAQSTSANNATISSPITTLQGLVNLMCKAFDYLFYGLIALSIIMVVIAGFNYVTAGDNAEKVSKANKMILYAAIGIAVALLARGIPLIVANFLGASTTGVTSCS